MLTLLGVKDVELVGAGLSYNDTTSWYAFIKSYDQGVNKINHLNNTLGFYY